MASRVFGLKRRRHRRILHRCKHRYLAFVTGGKQTLHRHVAQAARRHVGDAQQAHVVLWIVERLEIREKVPHFAPVEKTLPSDQMVPNAGLAQRGFQRPRLLVRPEQNRVVLHGVRRQAGKLNLSDHAALFLIIIERSSIFCAAVFPPQPSCFARRGCCA